MFVLGAAFFSVQAQQDKGGISSEMLDQIRQSYQGTSADKAHRQQRYPQTRPQSGEHDRNGYPFLHQGRFQRHYRPEVIGPLLAVHRTERDACQGNC